MSLIILEKYASHTDRGSNAETYNPLKYHEQTAELPRPSEVPYVPVRLQRWPEILMAWVGRGWLPP